MRLRHFDRERERARGCTFIPGEKRPNRGIWRVRRSIESEPVYFLYCLSAFTTTSKRVPRTDRLVKVCVRSCVCVCTWWVGLLLSPLSHLSLMRRLSLVQTKLPTTSTTYPPPIINIYRILCLTSAVSNFMIMFVCVLNKPPFPFFYN